MLVSVRRFATATLLGLALLLSAGTAAASAAPVVGLALAPDGDGYWLAESDGSVLTF